MKHKTMLFIFHFATLLVVLLSLTSCGPAQGVSPIAVHVTSTSTPIATARQTATQHPTTTPTGTSTPTKTPAPTETPYIYEGSYPGLGKEMLKTVMDWKAGVPGEVPGSYFSHSPDFVVTAIPAGTFMINDKEVLPVKLFWEAIHRGMVPDLTGMDQGVGFATNYPLKYLYKIEPWQVDELEKQNVAVIIGYGSTYRAVNPAYPKYKDTVGNTDRPNAPVISIMIGGSESAVKMNFTSMDWGFAGFSTDAAAPQPFIIDNGKVRFLAVIPLDRETIKDFQTRHGFFWESENDFLRTQSLFFDQSPTVMRGTKSIKDFLGLP